MLLPLAAVLLDHKAKQVLRVTEVTLALPARLVLPVRLALLEPTVKRAQPGKRAPLAQPVAMELPERPVPMAPPEQTVAVEPWG